MKCSETMDGGEKGITRRPVRLSEVRTTSGCGDVLGILDLLGHLIYLTLQYSVV